MQNHPVTRDPIKIAETTGEQIIEVYQGDFHSLYKVLPDGGNPVTALDIFDKNNQAAIQEFMTEWQKKVGGEIFIP
jgi:hypothetical protein